MKCLKDVMGILDVINSEKPSGNCAGGGFHVQIYRGTTIKRNRWGFRKT